MTVTAARYGYRKASIARVIGQAGVSRATFYQYFRNKEDCFLAAYRRAAERVKGDFRWVEKHVGSGHVRAILRRLLESADRDPAVARVFLIESLAASSIVQAEHEKVLAEMEVSIDDYLSAAPDGAAQLEIPARAVFGGVGAVIAIRVFRGETGSLIDLLDDLERWLASYALPEGRRRHERASWESLGAGTAPPREPLPSPLDVRLPRGRAALPSAVVASDRRQRLLAAVARVCREKGYEPATVADIVATAGVAREAFYEQFRSKEDVFLAAQAFALENSVSMAATKFFSGEDWLDRVWSAAVPMLDYIASVPDLTTLDFVESYVVGAPAIRRSFESRMAYTVFLEEGYRQRPGAEELPRLCSEAIAGGILELMRRQTINGRIPWMRELLPQVTYLALAPFVGAEAALESIEAKLATPQG